MIFNFLRKYFFQMKLLIMSSFNRNHLLYYFILKNSQMSLGTIDNLIQYCNLNRHIFEKQRNTKEHMERIMSILTQQNMEILQKEFELYPNGLELPTFIYLMKKLYTPQSQINKYYFVSDLIKFFQAIDINGDGHLQWSEFTEYIIENIRRVEKPNYKNKYFQQNQIISSAYSKVSNQYKITNVIDIGTTNCIKKVVYINTQEKYYVLEIGSNIIRIFNSKFVLIDYLELKGQSESSFIMDFSFNKSDLIFGAIFQNSARFCNLKIQGNVKTCNQCEIKKMGNYYKVQYLNLHRYWAFLSKNGELKLCTAQYKSRINIEFIVQHTIKQHDYLISSICEIQEPLFIATSSMDGNVKFFSSHLKKTVALQHIGQQSSSAINSKFKKGILGLDYTRQFGNYILTYGFCSAIYIYCLDVSVTKGFTGKYKEHSGNLIAAKFLKSFPYVLSFDDKLNMRIWDFRYFTTIQIINCQKNFINPSKLQIIPELSQCLVCQKKITQFRAPSLQKKSREINEYHVIIDFKICSMTNNIFLFTSNDVRIYNYNTGSLEKIFTKLSQNDYETNITACEFGYKSRKFFVGDAGGFVRQYCSETGQFLQKIQPGEDNQFENKAIVKITFLKEHSLLIVCSLDGRIMIYERNSQSQFIMIRDIRQAHYQLTSAQASARYCTLATGSQDGTVNIWNLQKLNLQGVLVLKSKIIGINFSPIHPIIIITQQTGVISFFYIRPYDQPIHRNKCFLKIMNYDDSKVLRRIQSINFQLIIKAYIKNRNPLVEHLQNDHHLLCVIGSEDGNITVVNMTEIIQKFQIQQNHVICSIKKAIKCQTQNMKNIINNQRKKIMTNFGYSNQINSEMDIKDFQRSLSFNAHNDKINKLFLVKENSIILTTSVNDKKLKLWNLQGQLNGTIDFYTFKKILWKVGEINFYKKIQGINTTIYSIKLIQNKRLKPQEQEFIKINLIINQYMNKKEKEDYIKWINTLNRKRNTLNRRNMPQRNLKNLKNKRTEDDGPDVLDQIEKYLGKKEQKIIQPSKQEQTVEFNSIYNKLITKIKHNLSKNQLPVIQSKKDLPNQEKEEQKPVYNTGTNINQFIASLRKNLRVHEEQQKKYEKQFATALNKKGKNKKSMNNMLYRSLMEVRKNIQSMQNKKISMGRKIL